MIVTLCIEVDVVTEYERCDDGYFSDLFPDIVKLIRNDHELGVLGGKLYMKPQEVRRQIVETHSDPEPDQWG